MISTQNSCFSPILAKTRSPQPRPPIPSGLQFSGPAAAAFAFNAHGSICAPKHTTHSVPLARALAFLPQGWSVINSFACTPSLVDTDPCNSSPLTHLQDATLRVLMLCHILRKGHLDQRSVLAAQSLTSLGVQAQPAWGNLPGVWASVSEQSKTQCAARISNNSQPESETQKAKCKEHSLGDCPRTLDSDGFPLGSWTGRIGLLSAASQSLSDVPR